MSSIEVMDNYVSPFGKEFLYILNRDVVAPEDDVSKVWEGIAERATSDIFVDTYSMDLQGASLFDAVKGYLEASGVYCRQYGTVSTGHLVRIDNSGDMGIAREFFSMVERHKNIENKVRSGEEDTELERFREDLIGYSHR
jgi:hypothetical protein